MFKNQLQELAQRSCFNLPSYACIREGPDHAPRFKASVNFNGEIFESTNYSTTLRQAEHAAAQVALNALSSIGPSRSLTARVLDETGVYKNLLQETAHRAGLKLPVYTTVRSGPGHLPVFTSTVVLAGMNFRGDPAKTKKQAEKNAAIAAWTAFRTMPNLISSSMNNKEPDIGDAHDQMTTNGEVRGVASIRRRHSPRNEIRKRYENDLSRRRLLMRNPATEQQQWRRLVDLICMNSSKEASSSTSTPKQNNCCFASLLPPPPPKTTSRILTPTPPNFPRPVHLSNSKSEPTATATCGTTTVEMLGKHLRRREEGDEWLDGGGKIKKPPIEKEGGPPSKSSKSSVIPKTDPAFHSRPIGETSCTGKLISTSSSGGGGYHRSHSHSYSSIRNRIAPAVHVRSAIPVCAAAPAPPLGPLPPASISNKEVELEAVSPTSSSDTCLSTQRVADMSMESVGLRLNGPESHTSATINLSKLRLS